MLAGVKFIPRDQINREQDESSKSISRKRKHCKKEKSSRYSSSDEEGLERIKKGSRKKKWYSSEEYSSSGSSEASSEEDTKKHQDRKRKIKERDSGHKSRRIAKGKSRSNGKYQSFDDSTSSSNPEDLARDKRSHQKEGHQRTIGDDMRDEQNDSHDHFGQQEIVRREMGLEWMLRPECKAQKAQINDDSIQDETSKNEDHEMKVNSKELNPYLRNNGSGYPEDEEQLKSGAHQLLSSSIVGDGGASWRLKALKRAQEQASREGRNLEEVVTERWGSLGQLAVNSASRAAAPSRAHLSAIKHRKKGLKGEEGVEQNQGNSDNEKNSRSYLRDVSTRNPEMRVPKVGESLSWKRQRGQSSSSRDAAVIYAAVSGLNKFANDGNFMQEALRQQRNDLEASAGSQSVHWGEVRLEEHENHELMPQVKTGLTANQLAAKALRLRMQGKHDEAEKIMQEVELIKSRQPAGDATGREWNAGSSSRIVSHDVSFHKKKAEDDSDMHLAQNILQNKQYSLSGRADDEYDFEGGPRKKSRKKGRENEQKVHMSAIAKRILTQQERCLFCFENPSRPKHLVVSIANFTYLMLPQRQPVVPGHCCILPMQHESATRTIDNNVWGEIRNFKKCLIMMFAKQDKELVFLETVMGLAQQRRHCLVECIPLPKDIAKEAPLYFKKAIDEAEDEWSQHNAKKLIDTSVKGLRASIPKDFPYFHVEFGLNKGFVHVIDDEKQFNSNLGFNVIRGMLQLPEEDMYRRRRYESVEVQKQAVVSFARDWEPFDWTKQLD